MQRLHHVDRDQDGKLLVPKVIKRPHKQQYQQRPFELFWSAVGCAQQLPLSGTLLRVPQTLSASPGLISLRLNLRPLRNHFIWSISLNLKGIFMIVCVC